MNSAYEQEFAFAILALATSATAAIAAWLLLLARRMGRFWKASLRVVASLCILTLLLFALAGVLLPWGHVG